MRNIIHRAWIDCSKVWSFCLFFKRNQKQAISVVETSLPPSRAGNGRILSTQRLIERRAIMRSIVEKLTPICTICTIPAHIPIGQAIISFAISLSSGVLGRMRSCRVFPRKSRVTLERIMVSESPFVREFQNEKVCLYSLDTVKLAYLR